MELFGALITLIGSIFLLLGGLGILRMPDVYNRMQAGTKATTLGSILFLAGISVGHYECGCFGKIIILILFVIFSIYHWRCLQADGRRVSKALIEKYAAFPVMVFDTGEGQFAESILSALKTIAPGMPAVIQPAGDPFDENIDSASAAVIPSNLLTHPPEAVRVWLEQYTGARLVIPVDEKDWLWVGLTDLSAQDMARQAAKMLAQFAEAQDTRQRRIHSPLTIIGYVFGALAGAALLCIASTAILEMF